MNVDLRLDGQVVVLPDGCLDAGLRAAHIATAVGLGPRPRPAVGGLLIIDAAEPTVEDVSPIGADWVGAVKALLGAHRSRWQLQVDGDVALDIVDAGDAGLWSVGCSGSGTVWRPVSSEQLWSALLMALRRSAA
jgi:hypothetical protein